MYQALVYLTPVTARIRTTERPTGTDLGDNLHIKLKTSDEISDAIDEFIRLDCIWKFTQLQGEHQKRNNGHNKIFQLFKEKEKARDRWQRSHNAIDRNIFDRIANNLKIQIQTEQRRNSVLIGVNRSLNLESNNQQKETITY